MQDAPGREGAHGPRGPAPALLRLAQGAPGHLVLSARARWRLQSGFFLSLAFIFASPLC